jgi:Flp pilus assembly protein TadG
VRAGEERGTAAVEFVLVVPVLIVILLFVVGLGRMAHARQQVEGAAADAARTTAAAALGDRGLACQNLNLSVDVSDYKPGGTVKVQVRCTANLGDVALSGLPGRRVFTAEATVPIETYRSS